MHAWRLCAAGAPNDNFAAGPRAAVGAGGVTPGLGLPRRGWRDTHAEPMLRPISLLFGCAVFLACELAWGQGQRPTCEGGVYAAWTFHAGAPVSEPVALSADGTIAVSTHEGYVHALTSEGALAWSYTVDAGVVSGVQRAGSNRFMVASYAKSVYSIRSNGEPHWVFRAKYRPERTAVFEERGVFFFSSGRSLFALSSRAGMLWGAGLGARVRSRLHVDREGAVWMLTTDGRVHRLRTPYFHQSWELTDASSAQLVGVLEDGALLVDAGELRWLGPEGTPRWATAGVASAAVARPSERSAWVVTQDERGRLTWLTGRTGKASGEHRVSDASGSLIGVAADRAILSDGSGRVELVDRRGRRGACRVGHAAALSPAFDRKRGQVVVATGDGKVMGIRFEEAPR